MRVLISTWPAPGHLLPMLPLARAAERAGHDVVIASGTECADEARRRGFEVWDVGPSRAEVDAAFRVTVPDVGAIPPAQRMATIIAGVFGAGALRRAEQLVPAAESWRPDLVVHPFTELAGAVAAERCGARHAVHGFGPMPADAWRWFGARFGELCDAWDVPHLTTAILGRPFLELCPPTLQRDALAAFTHRVPLRPTSGDAVPGEALPWDDATFAALPFERTVHVTLGTLFYDRVGVFRDALAGLGELEVNVVVTVGPGQDPAVLGPQPGHVLVADFVTHSLLLPRCDVIVSQGGPATILAALDHGLPHLILPQGADQFLNAPLATAAGVALALDPDDATPAAIRDAVRRLLDEPGFATTAARARAEIAAMPSADDVLARLLRAPAPVAPQPSER
jgi:UDP:flavonoid glycosyltransferase YjiC (YdhE family)